MHFWDFLRELLRNPEITNYIIALQIPTVICLGILSGLIYRFRFVSFKLIFYGWVINLAYLIASIDAFPIYNDAIRSSATTLLDITAICLFYTAARNELRLKAIRIANIDSVYWLAFVVWLVKVVPYPSSNFNTYISIRNIPNAIFDLFGLGLLGRFFRQLEKEHLKDRVLSASVYVYSGLQLLSMLRAQSQLKGSVFLYIDNIGFALGLTLKMTILLLLARFIAHAVKKNTGKEKEQLLENFSTATLTILNIDRYRDTPAYQEAGKEINRLTLAEMLALLDMNHGYFSAYDTRTNNLTIESTSVLYKDKLGYVYPASRGLSGEAISAKSWRLMRRRAKESRWERFDDGKSYDDKIRSALAYPLLLDDQPIGVYMIESEKEDDFSDLDIGIVGAMIHQAMVAIKNNELLNQIQVSKIFLDVLKQIDKKIIYDADHTMEPILKMILESALKLIGCESGNIDILKNDELECIASTNPDSVGYRIKVTECLSGQAVLHNKTVYYPDISQLTDVEKQLYKKFLGKGYNCQLTVPLTVNHRVIGVFNTESIEVDKFSKEDIDKIDGLAGQAAIVIHIANLIEEINKKNNVLLNSIDKRNIEISSLLSNLINHKVGNEVGLVRAIIKDQLLYGEFGILPEPIQKQLDVMLKSCENILQTRASVNRAVEELIVSGVLAVDFNDIKSRILALPEVKSRRDIRFSIAGLEKLSPILVSSYVLMEIMSELISNALKAMPKGGVLQISGRIDGGSNVITVTDNGCGIPKRNLTNIFVKGFSSWKHNVPGGGIGLAEIKRIVELWAGSIDVNSRLDKGTSVAIKLPVLKSS